MGTGFQLEARDTLSIGFFKVFNSERYQAPILGLEEGYLRKEGENRYSKDRFELLHRNVVIDFFLLGFILGV